MSSRVIVALRVAAPPERAFRVFTEEAAQWWRPNALFRFAPHGTGRVAFEGGAGGRFVEFQADGGAFEIGRISVWEPGARLVFGWRQEGFGPGEATEVEVRFERVGDATRVTVEHRGWDSVPAAHRARHGFPNAVFLQRHGEWWRGLLGSYAGRLSQQ